MRDPKAEEAVKWVAERLGVAVQLGMLKDGHHGDYHPDAHAHGDEVSAWLAEMPYDPLTCEAYLRTIELPDSVMPKHLRAHILRVLADHSRWTAIQVRNALIVELVGDVQARYGLDYSRSRYKGPQRDASACSVVAAALAQIGVPLSVRTVEGIFEQRPEKTG